MKLRLLLLLIVSVPLVSHAQSLGDVARDIRAEKEKNSTAHARVITNDDISTPPPVEEAKPESTEADASAKGATKKDTPDKDAATKDSTKADKNPGEEQPAEAAKEKAAKAAKDSEKERLQREKELQKSTEEINKRYIDRITVIRDQINTAKLQLAKLTAEEIEYTNQFHRYSGTNPTILDYQQHEREINDQMEAQRTLITTLGSQLEDAKEAARHAGVPHATDY